MMTKDSLFITHYEWLELPYGIGGFSVVSIRSLFVVATLGRRFILKLNTAQNNHSCIAYFCGILTTLV